MPSDKFDLEQWCRDIIFGTGGFKQFLAHEHPIQGVSREVYIVQWTLRCLANPACAGSLEAFRAVAEHRRLKTAEVRERKIQAAQARRLEEEQTRVSGANGNGAGLGPTETDEPEDDDE